jgi:hypothetical protein
MGQPITDKLAELSSKSWEEIASDVGPESVLFLDHGAAEILRWSYAGGAAALLEKGALNIYRLHKTPHHARRKSSAGSSKNAREDAITDMVCISVNAGLFFRKRITLNEDRCLTAGW